MATSVLNEVAATLTVPYETVWVTVTGTGTGWYASYNWSSVSSNPYNSTSDRTYHVYPLADKILAIILAILAIPGVMMNALVLWSLFCKIGNLNRPTRQLHGNMMFANTVLLLVCVPALSMSLYSGRPVFKNNSKHVVYEHNPIFCNISGYIFSVMIRMIMHISTVLAVDRVMAVQCPLFHKFKVQRWGYHWILLFIWLLNLVTMTTPFIQGNYFKHIVYECICNWKALDADVGIIRKNSPVLNTLSLLFFFGIPFSFTNLITILCCLWVIVLVLQKNLKVERRTETPKSPKSPHNEYKLLSVTEDPTNITCETAAKQLSVPPQDKGQHPDMYKQTDCDSTQHTMIRNGNPKSGVRKFFSSNSVRKVGRSLAGGIPSPVARIRQRTAGIKVSADARVKRACETMLIVIFVQLICYSVIQVMMLDAFLRWTFKKNLFTMDAARHVAANIIFTNYPIPLILFSILIPFVIHFRMIRQTTTGGKSSSNSTTSSKLSPSLRFSFSKFSRKSNKL